MCKIANSEWYLVYDDASKDIEDKDSALEQKEHPVESWFEPYSYVRLERTESLSNKDA